jgi:A/G-specific adenine glycosylase
MAADPIRAPLLRWYRRAKRDLPWRRTTDPYAIWVSEVMLQQTTVAAVIPYWRRFLDRFPDPASLAASDEEDVLALWSGLGYYSRARSLRKGAIEVMERHGGRVPGDVDSLRGLPGIGRYTAGAIASLAFGREEPVVDGNVKRVFARLFAIPNSNAQAERRYWSLAEALVRGRTPGDLNQALMELGATVCTPRAPRCESCPVEKHCAARRLGAPESFPSPAPARPVTNAAVAVAWIERRGRVLLVPRSPGAPLRGAWDVPATFGADGVAPGRAIAAALSTRFGLRIRPGTVVAKTKHSILTTRLAIEVVTGAPVGTPSKRQEFRWVPVNELSSVAVSGATIKIARAVAAQKRSQVRRSSPVSSDGSGRKKA